MHGYFFGTALASGNLLRIPVFSGRPLTVPVFSGKTGFQPTSPRLNISTAFTAPSRSIFMSNSTSFFFQKGAFDILWNKLQGRRSPNRTEVCFALQLIMEIRGAFFRRRQALWRALGIRKELKRRCQWCWSSSLSSETSAVRNKHGAKRHRSRD